MKSASEIRKTKSTLKISKNISNFSEKCKHNSKDGRFLQNSKNNYKLPGTTHNISNFKASPPFKFSKNSSLNKIEIKKNPSQMNCIKNTQTVSKNTNSIKFMPDTGSQDWPRTNNTNKQIDCKKWNKYTKNMKGYMIQNKK